MSAAAVTAAHDAFVNNGLQWSSLALLYYDYALTFQAEVKYIWRRDSCLKISTLLYIFCRYALLSNVLYSIATSDFVGEVRMFILLILENADVLEFVHSIFRQTSAEIYMTILTAVSIAGRAGILTVFLLRTYAVCGQSKLILLGLGPMLGTIVALDSSSLALSDLSHNANTAMAILVCVYDTVATTLTIWASLKDLKARGRPLEDLQDTFHYLVLEQGVLYFCAISLFTIPSAVFLFMVGAAKMLQSILNAFTLPFSGILAARFLLHLREYNERARVVVSDNSGSLPQYHDDQHVSTFRAAGRILATTCDDFGEDHRVPLRDGKPNALRQKNISTEDSSAVPDTTLVPVVFAGNSEMDQEIRMMAMEHPGDVAQS